MNRVWCIDGVPGSNKTSILNYLQRYLGYTVVDTTSLEEREYWLKLFETDPKRWTFTLEIDIFQSYLNGYKLAKVLKNCKDNVVFVKHSVNGIMNYLSAFKDMGWLMQQELRLIQLLYARRIWLFDTIRINSSTNTYPVSGLLERYNAMNAIHLNCHGSAIEDICNSILDIILTGP